MKSFTYVPKHVPEEQGNTNHSIKKLARCVGIPEKDLRRKGWVDDQETYPARFSNDRQ